MCIPGEDESQWNKHPHQELRCDSPEMHILTGNGDVTHRECTSSPGMGSCLTGNGDVTHRECTFSPGMHILTGSAHRLYRVNFVKSISDILTKPPCIMCVQYRGGCSVPWGDILSTVGVFSTVGGYRDKCGGYREYRGGVQYRGGYHEYRGGLS